MKKIATIEKRTIYADANSGKVRITTRGRLQTPHAAVTSLPIKGQRRAVRRSLSRNGMQSLAHASVHKDHRLNAQG